MGARRILSEVDHSLWSSLQDSSSLDWSLLLSRERAHSNFRTVAAAAEKGKAC